MTTPSRLWRALAISASLIGMLSISSAAELNPAAVIYKLPDQIPWGPVGARGEQSAVVVGDPTYLVADPTASRAILKFKPAHSDLATIIRTAWAWHQTAHPLKTGAAAPDGTTLSRAT